MADIRIWVRKVAPECSCAQMLVPRSHDQSALGCWSICFDCISLNLTDAIVTFCSSLYYFLEYSRSEMKCERKVSYSLVHIAQFYVH